MSASILVLTLAGCAFLAVREWQLTNRQLRSVINEAQGLIAEARPELRETLKQVKLGSFEMRGELKAFGEDLNSREQQRARLATQRAGESVAALMEQLRADTIPLVNSNLDRIGIGVERGNLLISNLDASLNQSLLPEARAVLSSLRRTSDLLGADSHQVLVEIITLSKQGQTSLEAVNKVLLSPEWESILKSVDSSARNIEATTAQLPEATKTIAGLLKVSAQFQKPLLIAQILAVLARALW